MTDNSDSSGPDLNKSPGYVAPVNPYPADQFTPYPPPYEAPAPHYGVPQYGVPQYGFPAYGYPTPDPVGAPGAVTATRSLGAAALVGALLLIGYGWLTFASFQTKLGDPEKSTVNGWGQVFFGSDPIDLPTGATGSPYTGVFIPIFVIPVVILGLLVACNIGRFGNSIAIFVLALLHLLLSLVFLAAPSMCILFEDDIDAELFESTNNFSTGPGAILTTVTLLVVTGTSLVGIILGRRKIYPQSPQVPSMYGGYQN